MNDAMPPLTQDEYRYLMIANQGGEIVALGDRMKDCISTLYKRGLLSQNQSPGGNIVHKITHAGKLVIDAAEDEEILGMIGEHNARVEAKTLRSKDLRPPSQDWDHSMRIAIAQLVGMIEAQAAATGQDPKSLIDPVIAEIRRQLNGA